MADYYEVLGVPPTATTDELRRAYRALVKIHHPDASFDPDDPDDADEDIRLINEAWDVLGDPRARRRYDATRTPGRSSEEPAEEWDQHLPEVPQGFSTPSQAARRYSMVPRFRAADAHRRARSLTAETPDLRPLSTLGPSELWWLDLSDQPIGDNQIRTLRRFVSLEVLFLNATNVTDAGVAGLAGLSLQTFEAADTPLSDRCVPHLAAMSRLQRLTLYGTAITDRGLQCLRAHPALAVLDVRRTELNGYALEALATLPRLRQLQLPRVPDDLLRTFTDQRPDVTLL